MAVYDTSAWIALHEPRDSNHKAAKARLEGLMAAQDVLVVGWHTLVELADGLARHYGQKRAALELERLVSSPRVRIEPSEGHVGPARELFKARPNWGVDLSDCLSFALMRARSISRVFTYDDDFRKAGFQVEG
ncbi:MAG: PIN domain-containing protein [Euryarchaeota archaeon]|nr:PIN domain-containing protein [Euryarchaeota archaeon]